MNLKIQTHTPSEDKEVVERLTKENLDKKLWSYLNKLDWKDVEGIIDLKIEKNKKWLFVWILQINIDWKSFRYTREDFKNLDDLVNHLFDHFKEELAGR